MKLIVMTLINCSPLFVCFTTLYKLSSFCRPTCLWQYVRTVGRRWAL